MIVKIGYIGSKHSVKQAENIAKNMSSIKLKTYTYESPNDVSRLHQKAACEVDVICFSGIVSYYYRNRSLIGKIETVISPFHKYMVVASLLSLMIHYQVTMDEVSIDLPDKRLLDKIEHDIAYHMNKNYVYDYDWIYRHDINKDLSFTNIAAFHERLYRQKKIKMAITSIHHVYDLLVAKNIPAMYMVDHDDNVKNVLDDARKRVLFSRLQDGYLCPTPRKGIFQNSLFLFLNFILSKVFLNESHFFTPISKHCDLHFNSLI